MKKFLPLFAMLLLATSTIAQNITIGTGTNNTNGNKIDPIDRNYPYIRYQIFYSASSLTAAGLPALASLTGLGFEVTQSPGPLNGYTIKIGHTTATGAYNHFSESSTMVKNAFTYTPTVQSQGNFDMITFDNNFLWNGIDNIFIDICTGYNDPIAPYGGVAFDYDFMGSSARYERLDAESACNVTTTGTTSRIPNIRFSYITTGGSICMFPSALNASSITSNSATISWTAASTAPANGYDYYYNTSNIAPTDTTTPSGTINNTSVVLNGLASGTYYSFWVRSNCGGTKSYWVSGGSFGTNCIGATNIPYIENFENQPVSYIPLCSEIIQNGNGGVWETYFEPNYGFNSKLLKFQPNNNANNNTWFITRGINLTAGKAYKLSLNTGTESQYYSQKLLIAYGTANTVAAMTTTLAYYDNIQKIGNTPNYHEVFFVPPSTGVYYFGFNAFFIANSYALFLDNIKVESIACLTPRNITATNVATTKATITWLTPELGTPNNYSVYYSTSNTTPSLTQAPSITNINDTTVLLTNLSPSTTYYVWVRSVCSATDSSAWSNVSSFTTITCSSPTNLTSPIIAADFAKLNWTAPNGGDHLSYSVFYSTNNTAPSLTQAPTLAGLTDVTTNITGLTPNTAYYIWVRNICSALDSSEWTNVLNITTLNCFEPNTITTSAITPSSVDISWSAPVIAPSLGYFYELRTSGAAGSGVIGLTSSGSAMALFTQINSLQESTNYTFYIRSVCNVTDSSIWVSKNFTTTCNLATLPYIEDFETTNILAIPLCTSTEGIGTIRKWSVSNPAYGLSTKLLALRYFIEPSFPTTTSTSWFYTRGVQLTAGTYYRIQFDYGMDYSNNVGENLIVSYGNAPSAAAMTNQIIYLQGIRNNTTASKVIDFLVTQSGTYYFGFGSYVINSYILLLDNIRIDVSPTCGEPTNVSHSNTMSTTTDISWTAPVVGIPATYSIYYSTSNTTPSLTQAPSISGITTINTSITGLTPLTTYYVWARSVCSATDSSNWSNVGSFKTLCPVSTNISSNSITSTSATIVWNKPISNYTASYSVYYSTSNTAPSLTQTPTISNINDTTVSLTNLTFLTTYYVWVRSVCNATDSSVWSNVGSFKTLCPEASNITSSAVTDSSVTIQWTAPAITPTLGYYYELRTSSAAGSGVVGLTSSGSAMALFTQINSLQENTNYTFYLRSVCDALDSSIWISYTFTTPCAIATLPYTENFESTALNTIPYCTTREKFGISRNWAVTNLNENGFNSNVLGRHHYNGNANGTSWFYTRGIALTSGNYYRLQFDYAVENVYVESMRVKYGNSATAASMSHQIIDLPSITNVQKQHITIDFMAAETGIFYLGFETYSKAMMNVYIDNIQVAVSPTCGEPNNVSLSNTMSTTTDISWTAPLSGTPATYSIYYSTSNTAPSLTQAPSISGITTINTSITGLTPLTTYYVWVRSVCSATDSSAWSNISSFRTLCSTPVNPTILSATATTVNVSWTAPTQITPASYSVFYSTNNTPPSLTQAPTISGITTINTSITDLTPTTTYYVWVRSVCNVADSSVWSNVDSFTTICPVPINISSNSITSTSATIVWNKPVSYYTAPYSVYYSTSNTAPSLTQAPTITNINDTTVSLTNLTPTTTYYVWVRSVCSATDSSNWSNISSFRTLCPTPVNPTILSATATTFDVSWTVPTQSTPASYSVFYSTNNTLPSLTQTPTTNNIQTTYLQQIGLSPTTNYYVWVRSVCSQSDSSAWVSADSIRTLCPLPTNVTTSLITDSTANIHWNVPLESTPSSYSVFYSTNNTIPNLTQAPRYSGIETTSVNLSNLRTGNNYYVWVRSVCSATDSSNWTNMVSIKTICNQPKNVQTTTITSLTATIKWDTLSSGSSAMYEYYFSTNNTAPTISTIPNGTTTNNSIFLTGLTQNTIYYFWVRSNCGGGDYSNWSTVLLFSTTCNIANLPWTEGFETMPYVGNRVVPTCWSIFDAPNADNFIGTSNINNGGQGPRTGSNYALGNEQYSDFYTPGFELKAGATYTFSFYAVNKGYVANGFSAYFYLGLQVKNQGGYSTIAELASIQGVYNTTYQQFSYTIKPTTNNVYYFQLRPKIHVLSDFSLSFDDFKLERSCSNPENVSVTNISGTSADVNWVAPIASTPSSYSIYYSTNNAIPSETQAPTIAGVTSTSTNISGLNPSTTYYVWVRSICSATDSSAWTNITSFTTQCITPTTQPTALQLIPAANFVAGSFTAASPAVHGYLVVRTNGTPPTDPIDGTTYQVGDNALGGVIVANGLSTNFTANGLTVNNNYSFYVYAYNNTGCVGNKYLTATPLTSSATTTALFVSLKNGVWHDTTTWNQRAAPTATDDVKISTGHTVTVNEVTGNASTLTIEGNLSITTGTLNASTIYLNGTTAIALTAANAIINTNNITHNTDGNINVAGSGYLNVNESFAFGSINNRTFTTGGRLVLKSTATGTARIADITNGGANSGNLISGNVAQERFIPAKAVRKWIFLSSPVAQSIASSWQRQIHITGAGTGGNVCPNIGINSNGFDATGSNAPNVYTYNAANIAGSRWTILANTSEQAGRGVGFRVNVRGDRSLGCSLLDGTPAGLIPTAITLKATGGLSNAQKNIGSFSITYPNVGVNNYVFIGNPYPSAISFSALQTANNTIINNIYAIYIPTNANGIYTYWDGNTNTFTGGTGYDNAKGNLIANGQAVFVKSAVAGDVTLSFAENQKTTETNVGYFRTARVFNEMIKVSLSQNNKPIDEAVIRFASDADISNTEVGNLDIASMNSGTYISSLKANKGMVVQTRDLKALNNDEVWLNIGATTSGTYQLNFSEFENFVGTDILFTDHFTNTTQSIIQNDTYAFSVDKDNAATKGQNRFSITFNRKITPVYVSNTIKMYPNPASKQVTLELPQAADNNIVYNIKITDLVGRIIMQQKVNAGTHQLTIERLTTGTYFVELIDSKGNRRTEKLVKQ